MLEYWSIGVVEYWSGLPAGALAKEGWSNGVMEQINLYR